MIGLITSTIFLFHLGNDFNLRKEDKYQNIFLEEKGLIYEERRVHHQII